ncbi:MAG: DNA polymerase III subunit epsilon [Gammaproteobacteria bacterium]|nr:DNA polymerase III subunit epsilon [Gammaproteobacteria bacterium]|tara:strand:- start:355 stop:1044 length:690 start_codon:yes stop_codon:yes gene_type:complete
MKQIILDTETTGISAEAGHRIIELGAIEIVDRKITDNNFQAYLNPKRNIDPGSIHVHGITDEFVSDKPEFHEIMQEFLDFINGSELVMHNAPFDTAFINRELSLAGYNKELQEICEIKDTLPMARKIHPGKRNSLDALCSRYGVDKTNRDLHGALIDAKLLAQVFLLMTGGQVGIFNLDQTSSEFKTNYTSVFDISKRKIVTFEPSKKELKEHEKYMKKLKQQSNKKVH